MQSTPVSKDLLGIKGSCFDIRLEYNENFIIVHLPSIDKMTKEVFIEMKSMLEDWWGFFKTSGYQSIFAAVYPTDNKMKRLVTMLNFNYVATSEGFSVYQFKE